MIEKCYNKTHNKALRDGNLKGLLITTNCKELAMTTANNTHNIERGQFSATTAPKSIKDTSSIKRTLQGVGYNSKGVYKAMDGGVMTPAYKKWHGMINRCYNTKKLKKRKTYGLCTVSEEWHDFQNFAKWFCSQKYNDRGYQVDKDLIVQGNKVYSPENCCLIPLELNNIFTDSGASRGDCPIGVTFYKRLGVYRARISINNEVICLGNFGDVDSASRAYISAKERHVKTKANEWRSRIDEPVYEALMKWRVGRDE